MKKFALSVLCCVSLAYPCTGVDFASDDGGVVFARTIEYGEGDLGSKLVISPRGYEYVSLLPLSAAGKSATGKSAAGKNGIKWRAKYGYVGISVMNERFIAEGVNEMGLNAGLFYFPHYGSLERYDSKQSAKSLVDMQLVAYLLSNAKSVDEAIKLVKSIKLVNIAYDEKGEPLPTAHYRVGDSSGKSIVIEITDGGVVNIHENKVGVLTNSPDFGWHVKNLNNYINLYAGNAPEYKHGERVFSFGAGTGALGLPGDITPPSRFVRAFYYKSSMPKPATSAQAVQNAFIILNNFDIPIWTEYLATHQSYIPKELASATQWSSVSELNKKAFYYKTMKNATVRKVDLSRIDFARVGYKILELDNGDGIVNVDIK